jgi:hypothetical protein
VLTFIVYSIDEADIESFTRYSEEYLSENLEKTTMTLKQAFEKRAREQTRYEIAKSLIKKGLSLQIIADATQLSLQVLQHLQAEVELAS